MYIGFCDFLYQKNICNEYLFHVKLEISESLFKEDSQFGS